MVFAWWEAHFPPRVLVHFSGNEYGKQTKLVLLRLAGLQKLEARWDELELRVSGAKRPQFISPHVTQPSLESRFHPQSPNGEASLGRLTHFSLTHHSGRIGERKMGKCLHESHESSPMLLLLPNHHRCPYFLGGLSLKAWATMVWTPAHQARDGEKQEQCSTGSSPMASPTATPATSYSRLETAHTGKFKTPVSPRGFSQEFLPMSSL